MYDASRETLQAHPFEHKEAWIVYQSDYRIVKKATGYEWLADLPATERDAENAKKIAMSMGITEANIKFFNNATLK